jgi:tripartite-type tricarboxylate transporter receptor subunit TctC
MHCIDLIRWLLAAMLLASPAAHAQVFPTKPVRLIVPYAAGGSGDLLARLLGDKLAKIWGRQVVVDNKPGAGGIVGTEAAAHADPDGHTLYLATDGPITIAPTLHKNPLPYDWQRDFAPVSMIAVGYQVMLSDPKLSVASVRDLVALAQASPDKYNFGSIGIGSAPHMAAELFLSMANAKMTHVPYRGSSQQAIAALISGDIAMFIVGTSTAVPFVTAGTVRGLAVTSAKRLDSLPDVPTFTEAGYPKMDYSLWFAVLVPGGTPPLIISTIHDAIARAVGDPDYKSQLQTRGFDAVSNTPDEMKEFLRADYLRSKMLIEKLGLSVN